MNRSNIEIDQKSLLAKTIAILERLISYDTSSSNSNMELNHYVERLLSDAGWTCRIFPNADKSKANLVAFRKGLSEPALTLSAHTDVVPAISQDWSHDPFTLYQSRERLYGRGTTDMKGFVACCLAILTSFSESSFRAPVILVLSYDEEVGCIGIREVLSDFGSNFGSVFGCLVGEPTGMELVGGHKGKQNYRVEIRGQSKHASQTGTAANAIESAARLIAKCVDLTTDYRENGPWDSRFDINYSTINVGKISGGMAANIVSEKCSFEMEIRSIPGQSCDDIAEEIRRFANDVLLPEMCQLSPSQAAIEIVRLSDTPALDPEMSTEFLSYVKDRTQAKISATLVPFGTEAGLFQALGQIPTLVCGPGNIDDAHTVDESIAIDQLASCLEMLTDLTME